MAKKIKASGEAASEKEEKGGSRIINIIIALVIIIIWLGAFAFLIKMDVGGFGSKVLTPLLKDVPIVNNILPSGGTGDNIDQSGNVYKNMAEALERIKELELQVDSLTNGGTANTKYISELVAEVERLKVFEENQKAFAEKQKEFDENVVFNNNAPPIEEYAKYYEGINPDQAAEIYRQVVEQQQYDKQVVNQAARYAKMTPAAAAASLQIMTADDLDLVCGILSNMKEAQTAAIYEQMDPATVAMVTKKMTMKSSQVSN